MNKLFTDILPVVFIMASLAGIPLLILRLTCKEQFFETLEKISAIKIGDITIGFVLIVVLVLIASFVYTSVDYICAHFSGSGLVTVYPVFRIKNALRTYNTITYEVWVKAKKVLFKIDDGKFSPLPCKKCEVNDVYNWICYYPNNLVIHQMIDKEYSNNVALLQWKKSDYDPVAYVSWWEWYLLKYGPKNIISAHIQTTYKLTLPSS